jgi:hypothetical protein
VVTTEHGVGTREATTAELADPHGSVDDRIREPTDDAAGTGGICRPRSPFDLHLPPVCNRTLMPRSVADERALSVKTGFATSDG